MNGTEIESKTVLKKILITFHAQKKINRRSINEEWIRETMNSPDQIVKGYGSRKVAQKKYRINSQKYLLRVVFEEQAEICVVITAYLTSQIDRYWEE